LFFVTGLWAGLALVLSATVVEAQDISAPLAPPEINEAHTREALGVGRPLNHCATVYPQREFDRGQEGWVIVEFTVTAGGDVENAKVIASSPPDIFDASALQGIAACRFEPKMVQGEPVAAEDVRERVFFLIED